MKRSETKIRDLLIRNDGFWLGGEKRMVQNPELPKKDDDWLIALHAIVLVGMPFAYIYLILLAIVRGWIGLFYKSPAGFWGLLFILPFFLFALIQWGLFKFTKIDPVTLAGFICACGFGALFNSYFLGCHPIWVWPGFCDVPPFVTQDWMQWYGPNEMPQGPPPR